MARIRSVKPGFFTDSELGELPPLHRLLFQGLWCHADREGVLEDKPRELKVKVLPYDACEVDAMLWDLHERGLVRRYQNDGHRLIFIPGLPKHQKFHKDEKPSGLAPFQHPASTLLARGQHPASRPVNGDGERSLVNGELTAEPLPSPAAPAPVARQLRPDPFPSPKQVVPTPPEKPPKDWGPYDFWRWAQWKRFKAKLLPEPPLKPPKLEDWWVEVRALDVATERLQEGYLRFGDSEHWQAEDPPLPFRGFISQWTQFTPQGATRAP